MTEKQKLIMKPLQKVQRTASDFIDDLMFFDKHLMSFVYHSSVCLFPY